MPVPFGEQAAPVIAELLEIGELALKLCEFRSGQGADIEARCPAALPHAEDACELGERETQGEGTPDHADAIDGGRGIQAVSGAGSLRTGQDADPLVMAQGIGTDSAGTGQLAGTQRFGLRGAIHFRA